MGNVIVKIEGDPYDVAEFLRHFTPVETHTVGNVYLTKDEPVLPSEEPRSEDETLVYTKVMVGDALKKYGLRIQQQLSAPDASVYIKGLIHSVVGDDYNGSFDSVDSKYYKELHEKSKETVSYGTWG